MDDALDDAFGDAFGDASESFDAFDASDALFVPFALDAFDALVFSGRVSSAASSFSASFAFASAAWMLRSSLTLGAGSGTNHPPPPPSVAGGDPNSPALRSAARRSSSATMSRSDAATPEDGATGDVPEGPPVPPIATRSSALISRIPAAARRDPRRALGDVASGPSSASSPAAPHAEAGDDAGARSSFRWERKRLPLPP